MNRLNRTDGIAIVSSLIIMAALMALGAGAIFLSITNLRIAQNTRVQTIAEHNAASGLDLALISVSRHFRISEGGFPTASALNDALPRGTTFEVVSITTTGDEGVVTVQGFGPSNAVHRTSARFEGVVTPTTTEIGQDPLFGEGFVTDDDIRLPGNGVFNIGMWAGGSISATGRTRLGPSYEAKAAGGSCQIGSGKKGLRCPTGVEPPEIESFDFDAELAALAAARTCDTTVAVGGYFDVTAYAGGAICIDPALTDQVILTGTARDLHVVGGRDTNVSLSAGVEPLVEGGVGIKLASGTVDLTDGSTSLTGMNSIFALNHIALSKSVLDAPSNNTISRTLIATEGDVRLNGGGNSNIVLATFWVNGAFCVNGTLNVFRGTALSGGEDITGLSGEACSHRGIRINGSITDAGMPEAIDNEDLPPASVETTYASAGIRILARRP